jgi:hypothetical protein
MKELDWSSLNICETGSQNCISVRMHRHGNRSNATGERRSESDPIPRSLPKGLITC